MHWANCRPQHLTHERGHVSPQIVVVVVVVVVVVETWPMKVEHELKMNHTEMSMIRWIYGVKLNERKKSEEL